MLLLCLALVFTLSCGCGSGASKAAYKASTRSTTQLVTDLKTGEPTVRAEAASEMIARADPQTVPALVAALGDAVILVREKASLALTAVGPAAAPALARKLDRHTRAVVRRAAGNILIELGRQHEEAVVPVAKALIARSSRATALRVLEKIGAPARAPLFVTMRRAGGKARLHMVYALAHLHDKRAAPIIAGKLAERGNMPLGGELADSIRPLDGPIAAALIRIAGASDARADKASRTLADWAWYDNPTDLPRAYRRAADARIIAAMFRMDDKRFVEDARNHGSDRLYSAAGDWAAQHGFYFRTVTTTYTWH